VAGGTRELAGALQEAGGLEQSVSSAVYFEFVIVAGAWRVIELDEVAVQRLARAIRKYVSPETA
jgi:hypothetical protein